MFPTPAVQHAPHHRACYQVALRNGRVEAMRKLIGYTETEAEELRQMSNGNPALWLYVSRALTFRDEVLAEFNRLVEKAARENAA